MSITERKKDHVALTVEGQSAYQKTAGFERYDFVHNALPEVNIEDIDTSVRFLNHHFSFPLFISSMTGGYAEAGAVNAIIARFCEAHHIPFGVGSQRIMLEKEDAKSSFEIVREEAPTAFIAANIGGAQLIQGLPEEQLQSIVEVIRADAIIVHLNPLQELMQPEGDRNFQGVREGIRNLVQATELPVIVKETGAGISAGVAEILVHCGVSVIDVAGAGGTSWGKVENLRKEGYTSSPFDEWGIPTVDCLLQLQNVALEDVEIIASGGVRSSFDLAKALCLGAQMGAVAQPVIKAVIEGGYEGLEAWFTQWRREFRILLCLLGCERPGDLSLRHLRSR